MPTLDGDGQAVDKNGWRVSASTSHPVNPDVNLHPPPSDALTEIALGLRTIMMRYVDHQQGSLKLTRSHTGADLHMIFTWTTGKYIGKYVYYCQPYWHLAYGLEVLWQKVLEVEAGTRVPTVDKMVTGVAGK